MRTDVTRIEEGLSTSLTTLKVQLVLPQRIPEGLRIRGGARQRRGVMRLAHGILQARGLQRRVPGRGLATDRASCNPELDALRRSPGYGAWVSTTLTDGIRVTVEAVFLEEHSDPEDGRYAFAYQVTIENEGLSRVQLRRRHWLITDGNGRLQEVTGDGVVGQQPILDAGEKHQYSSGSVLPTPYGTMEGSYEMHEAGGRIFEAKIPRFALQVPGTLQ